MNRTPIFTGIATALITPMTTEGVDYPALGRLIDWQIHEGIDALVICGTTGEASTLTDDEHRRTIDFAAGQVNGRVPLIAGTGSNDTAYAIQLTRAACRSGADAVLVCTPYYNKATQAGLVRTFSAIADASPKPVILYNVPSRTGVNIEPDTYAALAGHGNIVGIKEAGGNLSHIVETMARLEGRLALYSGNDDQIVPLLALGALGCISVLSNVIPAQTREMCTRFFAGDIGGAARQQFACQRLISALFSQVNPIPVKAAMAALGYCENTLRLPLTPMEGAARTHLLDIMRQMGLEV